PIAYDYTYVVVRGYNVRVATKHRRSAANDRLERQRKPLEQQLRSRRCALGKDVDGHMTARAQGAGEGKQRDRRQCIGCQLIDEAGRSAEDVAADQFPGEQAEDRKSTRLNSSHVKISYAVFCLKKKTSTYEI